MFSRQYLSLLYACLAIVPTSAFVGFSYSPRPTVFLQSTLGRNENEWGIPYSEDLPPLADNRMPVSRKLPNGGQVTLLGSKYCRDEG
jgi:hypothetical protein